jgi:hypothetical protein
MTVLRRRLGPKGVIPGRPAGPGPEPMNADRRRYARGSVGSRRRAVFMGPGLASSARPGMTIERVYPPLRAMKSSVAAALWSACVAATW